MQIWKFICEEEKYPGLWRIWYGEQIVTVGWPPKWLQQEADKGRRDVARKWDAVKRRLDEVRVGDTIVAHVTSRRHANRVGRIGRVVGVKVNEWHPVVPSIRSGGDGEQGRRIEVRWNLADGPLTPDRVVQLPEEAQFRGAYLRKNVCKLPEKVFNAIQAAVADESNWESLLPGFSQEKAMSDYIASFPERLEDNLRPHPSGRIRERQVRGVGRIDVLLMDHKGASVVVECKQGVPTIAHLDQLRVYMGEIKKDEARTPRGILVHGGSRKLPIEVRRESLRTPKVELVQYSLVVNFAPSV